MKNYTIEKVFNNKYCVIEKLNNTRESKKRRFLFMAKRDLRKIIKREFKND